MKAPQGTINVDLVAERPKGFGARFWIAGKLIRLAEIIASQKIKFSIKQTSENPVTADSILKKAGKR